MFCVRCKVLLRVALLIVLGHAGILSAQQPPPAASSPLPSANEPRAVVNPAMVYPFPGEKLVLDASWGGRVRAGRLTLISTPSSDDDGHSAIILTSLAESVGPVRSFLLAVEHKYSSFLDPATKLPFRFEKSIHEGSKKTEESFLLDQKKHIARTGDLVIEIPSDTRDITALLYSIRQSDLTLGAVTSFQAFDGTNLFKVDAEAGRRETLKVPAGEFQCVPLAVREQGNSTGNSTESDRYKIRVWLTDDSRRLPVLITASPSFGEVRVELRTVTPEVEAGKPENVAEPNQTIPVSPRKPSRIPSAMRPY